MRLIDADKLKKDILDLKDCYNGFSDTYDKACIIGVIDEQPNAQQEHLVKESDDLVKNLVNDCISRQAAIDCVNHMRFGMEKMAFDIITTALLDLPSAQQERKTGQWAKRPKGALGYNCTACGRSDISNKFDFCPNCGADMRGENDDSR